MPAPDSIRALCETFALHRAHYTSANYNETELRREFLDPLFTALGWDVDNKAGYADAYKDVIHEDAIRIGGYTKAPDYCFRIGGTRKFFVEAKKPSVNIDGDVAPAYQVRRYGWSAKLPLCILSDFEELAVYDTRVKPEKNDRPSKARILYFTFDQYVAKWDEIAQIFARDAILRGSFDKYADTAKGKHGTGAVDDTFLAEIERWRDLLARNLALRNPALSVRDLNFAVQKTIDRIIFLRICEDRGTEDYGRLQTLLNGTRTYTRLQQLFHQADARYNSGLFHFDSGERGRTGTPDTLTTHLDIDDKTLKDILKNLYYPDSPFEFSVLPADILGQVYEQFLGKTIRLTDGHQAKIEEKPEVRKAGGVYYTPGYIVDYIVRNTLGRLLDGDDSGKPNPVSIAKAAEIKVLDPACGSGSFLIVAYQYLLDWHLRQYTAEPATGELDLEKARRNAAGKSPKIYQAAGDTWRLTTAERKRILLNSIHGVDIDSQAVEVTKLSLLLKVLEGETQQQLQRDFLSERQRILPDLGGNIKCGNSLIGPDFYENEQMLLLDDESQYRINVFDWKKSFPDIMQRGGFDCVIGNPPYVLLQAEFRDDNQLEYFRRRYTAASYKLDTYHLFIEKALSLLCNDGFSSYITPSNYLSNNYLEPLRRVMLEKSSLEQITLFDYPVFPKVSVDTAVFIASKASPRSQIHFQKVAPGKAMEEATRFQVSRKAILERDGLLFLGQSEAGNADVIAKIKAAGIRLGDVATVNFGKQLRNRKIFTEDVIEVQGADSIPKTHVACLTGSNINRYEITWGNLACWQSDEARCGGCWDASVHNAKGKLICRQIGKRPFFGIDTYGYHCLNTVFMVLPRESKPSAHYLLGVLNSQLLGYFWEDQFFDQRKTFPKIKGTYLKDLPIRAIDFDNPADVALHDKIVMLVERMLDLNKKKAAEKNPNILDQLETQISATDHQIDRLTYQLYNLTEAEIAIVEGGKG
jgi:hypothetical protein